MGHYATRENGNEKSKILIYAILIFQVIIIGSLVRGIQVSYKSRERVAILQNKKEQLEDENAKLKVDAEYVQSDYYIEKVAREELQRAKPGEKVVILPESQRVNGVKEEGQKKQEKQLKNWEKWWELLVK